MPTRIELGSTRLMHMSCHAWIDRLKGQICHFMPRGMLWLCIDHVFTEKATCSCRELCSCQQVVHGQSMAITRFNCFGCKSKREMTMASMNPAEALPDQCQGWDCQREDQIGNADYIPAVACVSSRERPSPHVRAMGRECGMERHQQPSRITLSGPNLRQRNTTRILVLIVATVGRTWLVRPASSAFRSARAS